MVLIDCYKNGDEFLIRFNGHAEFAESGKDIVCAALSVLANELLFAAQRAKAQGAIHGLSRELQQARAFLRFRIEDAQFYEYAVEPVLECLRLIAEQYPANVCLCEHEAARSAE